ncbi:MAG: PEP-CTERM sorting domain-containing protein [Phycisphaerales bacterium]|nr:MAG: PEP-CTERM sorting domain-containing protein [Phycisphaerales bacterium]
MRRLLVLSTLILLCASAAHALDIMVISDGGLKARDDTILIADPEDGRNKYNDSALVWFLEDLGYNVDTRGMAQTYWSASKNNWKEGEYGLHDGVDLAANDWASGNDWRLQALLDADLVIMSRFMSSSVYNRDRDIQNWNELTVPVLCQNGHMARSGKLGWTNANNAQQDVVPTDMEILDDTHPFVAGFTSPVTLFEWSTGLAQSAAQNALGDYPAGAVVIGTYDGAPVLVDIPAGTDFDAHNGTVDKYSVAGARRAYMGHWTYDGSADWSWGTDISADYQALFAQVVAETIPEPATIALLGLGGLALLRKRR